MIKTYINSTIEVVHVTSYLAQGILQDYLDSEEIAIIQIEPTGNEDYVAVEWMTWGDYRKEIRENSDGR